jgi:hypothetical protein
MEGRLDSSHLALRFILTPQVSQSQSRLLHDIFRTDCNPKLHSLSNLFVSALNSIRSLLVVVKKGYLQVYFL